MSPSNIFRLYTHMLPALLKIDGLLFARCLVLRHVLDSSYDLSLPVGTQCLCRNINMYAYLISLLDSRVLCSISSASLDVLFRSLFSANSFAYVPTL
jgi:hypothetical protein